MFGHMLHVGLVGWHQHVTRLPAFLDPADFRGLLFPWGVGVNETHVLGSPVGLEPPLLARAPF